MGCSTSAPTSTGETKEEDEVKTFLEELKLAQHLPKFVEAGYETMDLLANINLEDLKGEIGLPTGHARTVLRGIQQRGHTRTVLRGIEQRESADTTPVVAKEKEKELEMLPEEVGETKAETKAETSTTTTATTEKMAAMTCSAELEYEIAKQNEKLFGTTMTEAEIMAAVNGETKAESTSFHDRRLAAIERAERTVINLSNCEENATYPYQKNGKTIHLRYPVAPEDLSNQIFDMVARASKIKQLQIGRVETALALRWGIVDFIVLAADSEQHGEHSVDFLSLLPLNYRDTSVGRQHSKSQYWRLGHMKEMDMYKALAREEIVKEYVDENKYDLVESKSMLDLISSIDTWKSDLIDIVGGAERKMNLSGGNLSSYLQSRCEEMGKPYVFVSSKDLLGRACGVTYPITACAVTIYNDQSPLAQEIRSLKLSLEMLWSKNIELLRLKYEKETAMEETEYVNEMERLRVVPKKQAAKVQVPKVQETTMAEAEIMAALNGEMKVETSTTETTATTEKTAMTEAEIMAALALMSDSDSDDDIILISTVGRPRVLFRNVSESYWVPDGDSDDAIVLPDGGPAVELLPPMRMARHESGRFD